MLAPNEREQNFSPKKQFKATEFTCHSYEIFTWMKSARHRLSKIVRLIEWNEKIIIMLSANFTSLKIRLKFSSSRVSILRTKSNSKFLVIASLVLVKEIEKKKTNPENALFYFTNEAFFCNCRDTPSLKCAIKSETETKSLWVCVYKIGNFSFGDFCECDAHTPTL